MQLRLRSRWLVWLVVFLCVSILTLWLLKPSPDFEAKHIDPELPSLAEPILKARVMLYLDGGSISVELFRTNGEVTTCFIQASDQPKPKWGKILIGTNLAGKGMGRELAFPDDHRAYLIRMIDQYAPRDDMKVQALVNLRGYTRDRISFQWFRILN